MMTEIELVRKMYKCPYCKAELDDFERDMIYDDEKWEDGEYRVFHVVECLECNKKFDYVEKYCYVESEIVPWEE